ncbi:MAG: glycosyl hydrolase family 57 [Patescibacteria group bacterium]|nr:glycosyl hydrolase family 57 [Patescibacteria group bacterium]
MANQSALDRLPRICGREAEIAAHRARTAQSRFYPNGFPSGVRAACANALHMQQPIVFPEGSDFRHADAISNLQLMLRSGRDNVRHDAEVFCNCYARMARIIAGLVNEGANPRIMLDYSGELLYGFELMNAHEILGSLRTIATDPRYFENVEWLGCTWGHAVAPSTPVQDFRLHVTAWLHHFAELFGMEAVSRVRGFSPAEMAFPNHPDVAYEFVRTLVDNGYRWVMLQVNSVELLNGDGLRKPHLPHRLVCQNSRGETASITVLVKTQGSDTKLVGQMQPYYEARNLNPADWQLAGRLVPPCVSQIGDGENGGVMMNDFPPKYEGVMREASRSAVRPMNGTEYLEALAAMGITEGDFTVIQPMHQAKLWSMFQPGDGPERLAAVIDELKRTGSSFDGASWTNNISWVRGYEGVLGPMETLSAEFDRVMRESGASTAEPRFRNALFHLLVAETSCFRYWGKDSVFTAYAREFVRRGLAILQYDF